MDFVVLTIDMLSTLAKYVGSYGMAIIIFTIIIRVLLWPVNVSQQRSMKNMQSLSPKMKMIQEKYKSNPQLMQQKLMDFYKENNFNPTAGCLPMLIQIPIFIMLYSALMSPQFIQMAGTNKFLFINRLDSTIQSNAGISSDGKFSINNKNTQFQCSKTATVYMGDEVLQNVKIEKPQKAVSIQGDIVENEPVELKIALDSLNLRFEQLNKVSKIEVSVMNFSTKETENVVFSRNGDILTASVPTEAAKNEVHIDVIILVALFGLTIWLSQKVMMATTTKNQDPTQAQMQKTMGTIMPIMIILTFVFIPIPAGALLYLVTSNIFQIFQTLIINKQLELEENKKNNVIDAKVIETKEEK